jgi:hypothetical protein
MDRRVLLREIQLRQQDTREICHCARDGIGPHWFRPDGGCPVQRPAAAPERVGAAS